MPDSSRPYLTSDQQDAMLGLTPGGNVATPQQVKLAAEGNVWAALPNLSRAIRRQNDATPTTLRIIGIGSSVGLGPNGGLDAVNAPSAWLTSQLAAKLDLLGNLNFQHTNGCVAGHFVADGQNDLTAAIAAAGGNPIVVPIFFGMNDGGGGGYYTGETLGGIHDILCNLIDKVRGLGADPVVFTGPHPNTTLYDFSWGGPYTYPGSYVPNATAAKKVADWSGTGVMFAQSYRHFRVHQVFRDTGRERGVLVVEAERYWFAAVAALGNDALFGAAQTVHPNLLGHQQSYQAAINDFVDTLVRPAELSPVPARKELRTTNVVVASGGTFTLTVPDYTIGRLTIFGSSGGGNYSVWEGSVISAQGKVAVAQSSTIQIPGGANQVAGVAGSASSLVITITALAGSMGVMSAIYEYIDQ